jgi:hypothetical protein
MSLVGICSKEILARVVLAAWLRNSMLRKSLWNVAIWIFLAPGCISEPEPNLGLLMEGFQGKVEYRGHWDEARILDGIRAVNFTVDQSWEQMYFASSGSGERMLVSRMVNREDNAPLAQWRVEIIIPANERLPSDFRPEWWVQERLPVYGPRFNETLERFERGSGYRHEGTPMWSAAYSVT